MPLQVQKSSRVIQQQKLHFIGQTIENKSNYSIIRVTLNTELDTLWMSPMFSKMASQNVTNSTFPKSLDPKASTYVGYTVIQVLM